MSLDAFLLPLFVFNTVLVLVDASVGYHLNTLFFRITGGDPASTEARIRSIRSTLTLVVTLYMFFNCLSYFRQDSTMLVIVMLLVAVDLGGQLYIRHRTRHQGKNHE